MESTHPSAYNFYQNNLLGNQARFNEDLDIDGTIGLSRQKKFKGKKDSNFYTFLEHIFQQKKSTIEYFQLHMMI